MSQQPIKHPAANAVPLESQRALALILESVKPGDKLRVPLGESFGLVCAERVVSQIEVPPFANSAMDGYAVIAEDTAGATSERPEVLRVIGHAPAGRPFNGKIRRGETVEIMTGAPMPEGADAVVRVEDTAVPGEGQVEIRRAVSVGTAVRRAGADSAKGTVIAEPGELVTPARIGLMASCGIADVSIISEPTIALCVGGDEVVEIKEGGIALKPGQIFDSNSPMLTALFRSWGFDPVFLGRLPDDPEEMLEVFWAGMEYDFFVTVGGVSMGKHDFVRECLARLGCTEVFWKVNQQPGGPLLFAESGETHIFGLPGNPVSCFVCSELYLKPALLKFAGRRPIHPPILRPILGEDLKKAHGKEVFLRGKLMLEDGKLIARSTGPQDSNIIRSIAERTGYIVFPAGESEVKAGTPVDFMVMEGATALYDLAEMESGVKAREA